MITPTRRQPVTPGTPPTPPPGFSPQSPQQMALLQHQHPTDTHDDDSLHSTMSLTITPCYNCSKYGVWLQNQFQHIITKKDNFFALSFLKIRSLDDIQTYYFFTPDDWKEYLNKSYNI